MNQLSGASGGRGLADAELQALAELIKAPVGDWVA